VNRPWRAAVVKLSSRVQVQWIEPKPLADALPGDLAVSRLGTLAAAMVTPGDDDPFVAASMYAPWEKPHATTGSGWIYADGSVHRLISDVSALVGQQAGHRILAAGDLNILYGYGEHGSPYWASRYATAFARMEAIGLRFVGPQPRPVAVPTRGPMNSRQRAQTFPRTTRVTRRHPPPPVSSISCSPPPGWPSECVCVR
jgi:hypothetical protein